MTKIWAMRGYSGSGKTTVAREIANEHDAVVVNRDLLRLQLLGSYWTGKGKDEDRVTIAEEAQVKAFLKAGVSVVVDATHLAPKFARKWAKLAVMDGHEFEVVDVPASLLKCQSNDLLRKTAGERFVGEDVINKQFKNFPQNNWPQITAVPYLIEPAPPYDSTLPDAVIVDIDGTIAKNDPDNGGRSPFDYSRVLEDETHPDVVWLVSELFRFDDVEIIILSGRDDTCKVDTARWLDMWDINYHQLIMRPAEAKDNHGNKLPDYQVKHDLFNKHIRGKYNVRIVLDDRQQVVDMWRRMGLKTLQCEPGDF